MTSAGIMLKSATVSYLLTLLFSPWATLGLSDIVRWHFDQNAGQCFH